MLSGWIKHMITEVLFKECCSTVLSREEEIEMYHCHLCCLDQVIKLQPALHRCLGLMDLASAFRSAWIITLHQTFIHSTRTAAATSVKLLEISIMDNRPSPALFRLNPISSHRMEIPRGEATCRPWAQKWSHLWPMTLEYNIMYCNPYFIFTCLVNCMRLYY